MNSSSFLPFAASHSALISRSLAKVAADRGNSGPTSSTVKPSPRARLILLRSFIFLVPASVNPRSVIAKLVPSALTVKPRSVKSDSWLLRSCTTMTLR